MAGVEEGPIILVVDDDRDFLQLTRAFLERHGYRVEARMRAPSWREFLRLDPALVLMDLALDGEDGGQVCRAMKLHKLLARLPVILISGHGEDRLRKEMVECKADGFLAKPIGRAALLQMAAHYVERHARRGGLHGWRAAVQNAAPDAGVPPKTDQRPPGTPTQARDTPTPMPPPPNELRAGNTPGEMRARTGEPEQDG